MTLLLALLSAPRSLTAPAAGSNLLLVTAQARCEALEPFAARDLD